MDIIMLALVVIGAIITAVCLLIVFAVMVMESYMQVKTHYYENKRRLDEWKR